MTNNQAKKFLQRIRQHVEKAKEIYTAAAHAASDSGADQFSDFVGWELEDKIQTVLQEIKFAEIELEGK